MLRPPFFLLALALAVGMFAWTVSRLYRAMALGRADLKLDRVGERVAAVLVYWLGQKRVAEPMSYQAPPGATGWHHLLIFWGFLPSALGSGELMVSGAFPSLNLSFLGPVYTGLVWIVDLFNLVVLAMMVYAVVRRVVLRPRLIPMSLDAAIILFLISVLMVSHFTYHGALSAAGGHGVAGPISAATAALLGGLSASALSVIAEVSYWTHVLVLLSFLNYLPYSKHIHILGSLPNVFFLELGPKMVMPKLNLEDENDWGVARIDQFSQKSLLDLYACTECARCSNFCPAYNTDKPLSPMHLIMDLHGELTERGGMEVELKALKRRAEKDAEGGKPAGEDSPVRRQIAGLEQRLAELPPLIGGRIKEETLWACTTCGACQQVCPVFINQPMKIQQMKTHLALNGQVPQELVRTFNNLERNNNPWGLAAERRMEWSEGLEVPTVEDKPAPEYLLFVGCAGAFDDRIKRTMRSLVEVLQAAKVSFAVLGHAEACSGDPARRAGNEFLFQQQAEQNVTAMKEAQVRKVIASCPHCFHTIKNEYPQFGGEFEVIHHSQLLSHLLKEGKLKPETPLGSSVTYHDSCYIGRWNGEYDAPRDVLSAIQKDHQVLELPRRKERGFCCGAGGGRMWQEEKIGTRVNRNRTQEILESGAEVAAVACPFCTIMITDGVKDAGAEEKIQVLDIAEVVRKSLKNIEKKKAEAAAADAPAPE